MSENSNFLRVVSPDDLGASEKAASKAKADKAALMEAEPIDLVNYIRSQWEEMRDHRSSSTMGRRLLASLRVFNGEYDPEKLVEIAKFSGSQVYSRVVGTKIRGATALLRDVYFSGKRAWGLSPTPSPTMPEEIVGAVASVVQREAQTLKQSGAPITPDMVQMRMGQLMGAARQAAIRKAEEEAKKAEDKIDDFLTEGGFYTALAEFLVDLPLFPFAVIKGPAVRMNEDVRWENGRAVVSKKPKLIWKRVSPFDVYWTPGVSSIGEAMVCERLRWTRKDLNDLIGLPGWNEEAVRASLAEYDGGLRDWMDTGDEQRATQEDRESPTWNRSGMIDALEYHGTASGKTLKEAGIPTEQAPEDELEYYIQAWVCGKYVLKVQINPNPRKRHPYFVSSFEKVPGTVVGNGLPDILSDIEDVANAAMRALVNNMAMASGPQVVILDNRLSVQDDSDALYPWKRWHVEDSPLQGSIQPVSFFQPSSNAQELLGIYQKMTEIADEISAIPKYVTGGGAPGGAGRTSSGLSMLMGNAAKMLQQVAANVDGDVIYQTIEMLFDLLMLTLQDEAGLRGDENIVVKGVSTVMAREAERARQLEFLQLTANPIDMQIIGLEGRAEVLNHVADDLGMPADRIVPTREAMADRQKQMLEAQHKQMIATGGGEGPGQGIQQPGPANSTAPIENTVTPGHNTGGLQ